MGSFELAVMHCVIRLRDNAYGRSLHDALETRLKRDIPMGQVYVALARLEQKGFLRSKVGEATAVRGGRSKKLYTLTALGAKSLNQVRRQWADLLSLTEGMA